MRILVGSLIVAAAASASAQNSSIGGPSNTPITIHAASMIDGRGREQRDVLLTVRAGKIEKVEAGVRSAHPTYELGQATLLPGLIDAHTHPGWYINKEGALHNNRDGDTPVQSALSRAGNLYATLMAGFTTIQSVGGMEDLDLRDAVNRWQIPGPRILTSLGQMSNKNPSPDSLRAIVRNYKARGADVISCLRRLDCKTAASRRCPTNKSRRFAAKQRRRVFVPSCMRSAPVAFARRRSAAARRSNTARSRRTRSSS